MEAVTDNTAFAKEKARPGYKKTKLGWIPEEWKMLPIKDLTTKIGDGLHSTPRYSENTEYYFINGNNLVENKILITENTKCVDEEEYLKHKKNLDNSTLFLSINGTIGNIAFYNNEKIVLGKSAAYLNIDSTNSKEYLAYQLQTHTINNLFKRVSTGSTIKNLGLKEIQKIELPIPPLPEQQKIASILNTWDRAIAAQEQVIAQKQELKKGLMQELLTGKKRFDGFEGKWIKTELKEIGTIIRGASPRPKGDPRYYGGNVPRLMVKDVTRDGKYVTPKIDFLTEAGAAKSRPCKAGTLTIVCSGDVGVPSFLAVDACIHDGFLAIIDLNEKLIIPDFLYYQLRRLRTRMERSATHGGVFTNLTTTILKEFIIEVPAIKEQLAIIALLSKTDKELEKEEFKLKSLNSQKQGLMQQLLTGVKRVKI